jgi:catechol 2,3-dioxygenase-like lactoylglutathione lyase family enzyme
MIFGAHVIIYSKDAEADRSFFRDVLGFKSVDAGHGWLIFSLPPGEVAFHPADKNGPHELYLVCEGLEAEMAALAKKGVTCSVVQEGKMGFNYKDTASRWRQNRPLSTEASDSLGPRL